MKNRNKFYQHPEAQNFFLRLKEQTYEKSMEILASDEPKRIFKLIYEEGYDTSTRKRLRFDLACAIVAQFELNREKYSYISQKQLFDNLICRNMVFQELKEKYYRLYTARKASKEQLNMIVGSTIVQFFPECGGSKIFSSGGRTELIYPLQPKKREGGKIEIEIVKYPESHPIREINTLTAEERKQLQNVNWEIAKLKRDYKANLKNLETKRKTVLELLKYEI